MKMNEFLVHKTQAYSKIDKFMMFRMYEKYKQYFCLKPIIHIVGTNGKGSTGRFLAQLLEALQYRVGHYTSPHLLAFNERFYLQGHNVSDELLNAAHLELESIFKEDLERLSYFEYATFLAAFLFKDCDFVIFEAGLGGEYDATSVFEKELSIFTKIDFDHTEILGTKLENIARTKLKVMAKKAIISGEQKQEVLDLAQKIALLKESNLQMSVQIDTRMQEIFQLYCEKYALADFLRHNLLLALNALTIFFPFQRVFEALQSLKALNLRGRCEQIAPNVFIDVGHNIMAARALRERFYPSKVVLVYNSFLDKDVFTILKTLKPIIDIIKIYKYPSQERELANKFIFSFAKVLNIQCQWFENLDCDKTTLVFGSFVLVENFLKEWSDKE
ncbi:Mur ligase family protein [Campylobacter sp. MIT 21-1685]|uniref:Mur ligase family protein n=1 Tax=unclassified Campylobacter TaxID=2593542 RepID=UPI00224A5267|nr:MULTISPECIES: Mur ligase family protein [unclassified Campylobacter]MCX2682404.1 Mur ligase family protein [Campylobacter sp. MIT 21-1684]MCX2750684.1 Mur ligase family protein [Campylobacter sp. MIT 21-1682]MCX2806768.1 Mur ligase family protein [Campylobacter sp. MIT 21-1685]